MRTHLRTHPANAPFRATTRQVLAVIVTLVLMSSCASVTPSDYADEKPVLALDKYFDGRVDAWGMFQDRSGKVVKRFTVDMLGTWQGNNGMLEEDFTYSDGTTERRVWKITKHSDGRYTGTAGDVIGQAHGQAAGNALNWKYTLALPVDDSVYHVTLNDWMYLINNSVLINRAEMSKFGVRLGEVTITFMRRAGQ